MVGNYSGFRNPLVEESSISVENMDHVIETDLEVTNPEAGAY